MSSFPPYGICDEPDEKRHVGCQDLMEQVQHRVKPRLHCFGHIHEGGNNKTEMGSLTLTAAM